MPVRRSGGPLLERRVLVLGGSHAEAVAARARVGELARSFAVDVEE
ncbi:hypothetical protein [Spirillospora sp. CA-294931]